MLRQILLTALITAIGLVAPAAELPTADPESVWMSSARLGRINLWLDEMVDAKQAAGFVTLVSRHGKVVHHRATGIKGMEVPDAMPLDALFDIASMTKPITAAAALMLLEEGRFTLGESVSKHLPEFTDPMVAADARDLAPAERTMTIRHLFTHTSGVRDPRGRAETYSFSTMEEYMQEFSQLPLQAEPGTRWIYGDSLDVLGHLVERVSGQRLDAFLQERVFDPLRMTDTHYWPPSSKQERRALLVVDGRDDPTRASREPLEAGKSKTFISGASGLHTTAADYWRFCQMLLNGGELENKRLLGPRTVSWMAQNHLEQGTDFRPGLGYGLGVAVVTDRAKLDQPYSKGSYYWGGSQGTVFWIDPSEQLIGILMVQVRPGGALKLREKFAALVYSAILN